MANTWRATSQAIAYASAKHMIDVFNAAASARWIRVYRIYHFNNGTTAVTGVLTTMQVLRSTAASVGTAVTPVSHDLSNIALDANTTAGTNRTVTTSDLFRQYIYSNDEPAVSGTSIDEWECLVPFALVWDAGYGDSTVQPLTCRASNAEGVTLKQSGTSTVGTADCEMEFTDAAT